MEGPIGSGDEAHGVGLPAKRNGPGFEAVGGRIGGADGGAVELAGNDVGGVDNEAVDGDGVVTGEVSGIFHDEGAARSRMLGGWWSKVHPARVL